MTRGLFTTLAVLALGSAGCSSNGSGAQPGGDSGSAGTSANGGHSGGGETSVSGGAGGSSSAGSNAGGGGASAGAGGAAGAFPNGGGVYKTIVNIVDAAAMQQTERVLASVDSTEGFTLAAQDFYALYPDDYDFLYFILDHDTGSTISGLTIVVNRPSMPGTGIDRPTALNDYGTHGRLKSAVGFQGDPTAGMPPFAHETVHFWGNDLDPALGFGKDLDRDYGSHWGETSVYGQLGGFELEKLRCANPAGAMPPACTAETNGRFRYTTSAFGPNTNSFKGVVYAPLELYLMGLAPQAEVPSSFALMQDAHIVSDDVGADSAVVEASGIGQIEMSAIVARHGARVPATEAEKHFTAAFVLVTATPASPAVLDQVVEWQEIFGNHAPARGGWISFEAHAAKRATLETRIGRRRSSSDLPPVPPVPDTCDVLLQNCGTPTLGCYYIDDPMCVASGSVANGGLCQMESDCAPGSMCTVFDFNSPDMKCEPYCDPNDDSAPKACSKLCPNNYIEAYGADLTVVGGICQP